jgi:hypothetical protein
MFYSSYVTLILVLLGFLIYRRRSAHRNLIHPHPPGPSPEPLIGNLRHMPKEYPWLKSAEWGKKYGPLTYLNAGGQPLLFINSHKAAVDLLEKRGQIYSDRPAFTMCGELLGERPQFLVSVLRL